MDFRKHSGNGSAALSNVIPKPRSPIANNQRAKKGLRNLVRGRRIVIRLKR